MVPLILAVPSRDSSTPMIIPMKELLVQGEPPKGSYEYGAGG